jgi:hypothetical protein
METREVGESPIKVEQIKKTLISRNENREKRFE